MSGLGAKDILRNITALEQLIEEINFQRAKEMRQCLMSKDSDSGFVMVQGTTYWTDLFVRHFLFQTDRSTDADDLLFFIRKRPLKGSKYIPKYQTEVEVYRKDSRKLPIGDPDIDWEETVYLNLIIHQFDYTLTLAVCTRTSPKELQVLKRHSQKVYASPSRRRMDTKGEVEEITYPNVCFHVDNFDEVFADMLVRDGEMVCVELVASDHAGSRQAVIFLGSIRYDALKRVYDTRASLSSKMAQRMMLGLFNNSGNQRIEFVRMKGPQGKGHAEMAVTKPKGSGVETPTSEPGVSLTDMWDSDWEDEPEDRFMYRHQRRLSDPSANFNTFINSGWKSRHEGARSRSENEGLDCFADGLYEIESGDVRDAVCSGRCCSVVACKTIQEEEEEEAGKGVMCDRCQRLHGQTAKLPSSQCLASQEASPVEATGSRCQGESSPESAKRHMEVDVHSAQMELDQHSVCDEEAQAAESEPASPTLSRGSSSRSARKFQKGIYHPLATSDDEELSVRSRHSIDPGTTQAQNEYEQSTKYRKIPGLARRVSHREELKRKVAPSSVSQTSSFETAVCSERLPGTVDQLLSDDKSNSNKDAAVSPRHSLQYESETSATEATSLLDLTVATEALTSLDVKRNDTSKNQSDINTDMKSDGHLPSHCMSQKQTTTIVTGVPFSSSRSQVLDLHDTQPTQQYVSPSSGDSTRPQPPCTSPNNSEIQIETGVEEGITLDGTADTEDPVDAAVEVDGEEARVGRVSQVCNASPLPPSSFAAARATAVATSLADADAAQATTADGARDDIGGGVSLANMYTADKSSGKSKKVSVPYRTTVEGTTVYFLCDIKLDDGAYNPLWTTRGFTQTFHFWKESRRAQSVPLNAYLTYVTLPWFTIITDILDHSTGPILTF